MTAELRRKFDLSSREFATELSTDLVYELTIFRRVQGWKFLMS